MQFPYIIAAFPTFYIALWVAVGVLSVVSVVIVRSPWGRRRPLHRCVILSLVAHLVLIGVAAMIKFVSWPPGAGLEEPVRITIVASAPHQAPVEQLVESPAKKQPEEAPEEMKPEPEAAPLAPPELIEEPKEPEPKKNPEPAPTPETIERADIGEQIAAPEEAFQPPSELASPVETPTPIKEVTQPAATPAAPAVPPALAERVRPDRLQAVIQQGGSRETEQAVGKALEWLADAQSSDGRWDSDRWQGGREFVVLGHNRGGAGGKADTGISALALLTFLGAGHSHQEGPYRQTMADGLNFVLQSQASDGSLYGDATLYAQTYCHSMATFALAEAYALTGDKRLDSAVRKAVEFLLRSENTTTGGWRYGPAQPGDVSQLGWIIMALRSAELAGVDVPDATWTRIEQFLNRVSRGRHGGLAAYQPNSQVSRAMTTEALYCRQVLGKPLGGDALSETLASLAGELPGDGQPNLYYWYYATLALHHVQHEGSAARNTWNQWNDRLKKSLVEGQVREGSNAGSWSPHTVWGGYGGRVYSTAMAAMCLEVYYRFGADQGDQSPWMATRPRGEPGLK